MRERSKFTPRQYWQIAAVATLAILPSAGYAVRSYLPVPQESALSTHPGITVLDVSPQAAAKARYLQTALATNPLEVNPGGLLEDYAGRYLDHGKEVTAVLADTESQMGISNDEDQILALEDTLDQDSLQPITDRDGSKGVSVDLNAGRILKILQTNKSPIDNFSFEVGRFQLIKRQEAVTLNSAYLPPTVYRNLQGLFRICHAYPHRIFIAAAGNNGEDLRGALRQLEIEGERPSNLLLVAEEGENPQGKPIPKNGVYGADIYVDNSSFNAPEGSSFSAPIISAFAKKMLTRGSKVSELVKEIKANSRRLWYQQDSATLSPFLVFTKDQAIASKTRP